jgi:protein subunit release factor B
MAGPGFWDNQEKAQGTVTELKSLKALLRPLDEAQAACDDLEVMIEMAEDDASFEAEVPRQLDDLDAMVEALELKALLNGPMDGNAALLSINARDGGTDANDWAEMLLRMYIAWAQKEDYKVELLDRQENEEAGINSACIAIRGPMAYGYLKGEEGMHRLVRISPFNSEGKRQHKNRATARKMLLGALAGLEAKKREEEQAAKYNLKPKTGFGAQIRNYFLHPDQRVKDARTGHLIGNFNSVLDGNIQPFLDAYLRWRVKG